MDTLIEEYLGQGKTLIIEGVNLEPSFIKQIMTKYRN